MFTKLKRVLKAVPGGSRGVVWCADESTDVSDSQNAGICVFFVKNGEASCAPLHLPQTCTRGG